MQKILISILLITSTLTSFAQEQEKPQEKETPNFFEKQRPVWRDKVALGGNVWFALWGSFYVDVSPMVGYQLTEKGTVGGVGASFIYQGGWRSSTSEVAVGPRFWIRQQIFRSFFAHAEYELMNAKAYRFYSSDGTQASANNRKWEGSPLIGAGLYQGRGRTGRRDRGSFISIMYNLGYPNKGFVSPQGLGGNESPIILRYGFLF